MAKRRNDKELKEIEDAQEEGMPSFAAELSSRYSATYPDDIEGRWLKGTSLYYLDRNAEAKQQLEDVMPHLSRDFLGAALTFLARICRETGNLSEAARHYSKAIETDPKDSDNYVELGSLLLAVNRTVDAEKAVLKGIKAGASPIAELHFFLGHLLRSKGEIVKSADAFRRVLEDRDDENAETAIEDLKKTAALKGIEIPIHETPSKDESESDSAEKEPGEMTANIHREFFVAILKGEKKIEYRNATDYWAKRIKRAGEPPFHLRLINGMLPPAPELTVVVEKVLLDIWEGVYELHLGKVIDLKHWDKENETPKAS